MEGRESGGSAVAVPGQYPGYFFDIKQFVLLWLRVRV